MKFMLLLSGWLVAAVLLVFFGGTKQEEVQAQLAKNARAILQDCVSNWPASCDAEVPSIADEPALTNTVLAETSSICSRLRDACEPAYFVHRDHGSKGSTAAIAEVACIEQELHQMCSRAASDLRDLNEVKRALRAARAGCSLSSSSSACAWQEFLEGEVRR